MGWRRKEPAAPAVTLFDLGATGAALTWTDERSRSVAIEMFVELARRLEQQDRVERLRLSGLIGTPVDVADVATFVETAPHLLTPLHQAYQFAFRVNEGERVYQVRHLDQAASGIWFNTPATPAQFRAALAGVLTDFAVRDDGVRVSSGAWGIGGPVDA